MIGNHIFLRVRRVLTHTERALTVLSNVYAPYEPSKCAPEKKQEVKELKSSLRTHIHNLQASDDEMLFARYSEHMSKRYYDLENKLFYNIGATPFKNCARTHLASSSIMDEERSQLCKNAGISDDMSFMYTYDCVPIEKVLQSVQANRKLIVWQ